MSDKKTYAHEYYLRTRHITLKRYRDRYANDPVHRAAVLARNAIVASRVGKKKRSEYSRRYYLRKPVAMGRWARENPEKRRASAREYAKRHRMTLKGGLDHRMSTAVLLALKGSKRGRKWEVLVGYSVDDLRKHLESKFLPGMNWERFANGEIHIDHIIAKSKFVYETSDSVSFRQCWALENLRPLWKRNNLSKGSKILEPSQIALGV